MVLIFPKIDPSLRNKLKNKCVVKISELLEKFAVDLELTGITSNIAIAYWARVAAFKLITGVDHILSASRREAFREKLRRLLNEKKNLENDGIRCQKAAQTLIKLYAYKLYISAENPPKGNEMDTIKKLQMLMYILDQFELTADLFMIRLGVRHLKTKLEVAKYGDKLSKPSNSTPILEETASARIKEEVSDTTDLVGEVWRVISTVNGKRQRNEDETPTLILKKIKTEDGQAVDETPTHILKKIKTEDGQAVDETPTHILKKIKTEDGQAVDVERRVDPVGTCQEVNKPKQVIILSSRTSGIMTQEEIDSVRQHLLDTMINFMSGPSNTQGLRLRFINSEWVEPGWFQVTTEDEGTEQWLLETYTPDSVGEVNFKTVKAVEAPWPQKIGFYLKSQEVDLTRIIKMIGLQNCELNVNRWKHVCTTKAVDGWFVNFMVDQEDARRLEALGWTLFFELGKLAVVTI